ncbi:MAG: hypothetical protein FP816_20495 [Desulfobacteraceae bacterium]|nr:hypothetical protein [Desulfobacteraceae bacterium]MBU3925359.1 hypothetical protein [Patescibacteria group bacterium]MBU4001777.1 hypothetical protein [Pseudomonadota bacterium]MBU4054608.1 hypothetical protein [Pseudomonadota bacterium]
METKLTLRIDEKIIGYAKIYAKKNKTSVSKMVSNYLDMVTQLDEKKRHVSAAVKELSGIIPPDADTTELISEYHSYLQEKHK